MDVDEVEEVEGSEGTPAVKDAREGKKEDHAAVSRSTGSAFPPRSSVTASLAISEGLGDGSRAHQGRHKHSDKLTIFRLVSTAKLDNRAHLSPVSVAERSRVDCVDRARVDQLPIRSFLVDEQPDFFLSFDHSVFAKPYKRLVSLPGAQSRLSISTLPSLSPSSSLFPTFLS